MGRGNRKKKKEGNIAYADMVASNKPVSPTEENFIKPSKNKSTTAKNTLIESKPSVKPLNIKKNTNVSINEKQVYVNNYINYYWQFVGKYHHIQDIVLPPDSDEENEYNYDEY